jgi:outer membrane protein TolC
MDTNTCWTVMVVLIGATSPASLAAQESALPALVAEAEAANPEIVAARKTAEAAAARVPQAGALPDPTLGFGFMNVPVANPSLRGEMMTMTQVQVGTRFPWPGKLPIREDVARLRAEAAEWEAESVRNRVVTDVKQAYYRVYFLDRALDVIGRNEALVDDLAQLTSAKYAVGTGAQPDVLKAQVERSRLADQRFGLREQRTGAVARLNALLGRPTDAPLPFTELPEGVRTAALAEVPGRVGFVSASLADVGRGSATEVGPLRDAAELQQLALAHNPMIQAHVRRVAAQERSLSLAKTARLPDLSVSAGYSHRAGFGDFFNVMVSAPLPIFAGRKQDQAVLEQAATLAEHEARHRGMVNDLNAEIASLTAELERARDQLVLLQEGILPQAGTSLSSATASYQVGAVDFLTLLDAQVTLYRLELDYHRLLADFAENLAALERAVGTEVLR